MGAENSVLEGCEWEEPLQSSLRWTINPVVKPDGATATVFQAKLADKKDGDLLKKNTLVLRGIRHPNIIRYVGAEETRDDVWLATEYVRPLILSMADLTSDEICVGLHELLQALDFLHSMLGMCHNNLCLSSLFLGHAGTWKLGELQHSCKFSDATQAFLDQCRAFRKEDSLAPEEKAGTVKLDPGTGHARDMFAFGAVVDTLLEGLRDKDDRLRTLEQQATACLSPDPTLRPTAASLLKLPFLRSDLFEIIDFLKNVTMKSEADKKDFFSKLVPRLRRLPEPVVARRLVIPLLTRFVLLDESADRGVIPHLLTPRTGTNPHGLLTEGLFKEYVIPQLYNIFHVHDCHIRLILLQHFPQYVHLFSREQLDDDIFLQILLGVRDSDDSVVAASLRGLADLVPIMGGDVVVGAARKPFFFHGLPKQVSPQELAQLSGPQNVTMVLSSHKPLLRDLAAGSVSAMMKREMSAEDKERKAREREQRREEAKLKREERRKRLKEKQIDKHDSVSSNHSESESSVLTIEEVARLQSKVQGQGNLANDDVGDGLKLTSKNSLSAETNTSNSNIDSTLFGNSEWQEGEGGEKEEPDWSDWEDADQRIEEEIEDELRQMSDESDHGSSKVQTSPSPYRRQSTPPPNVPPGNVKWDCDVLESERAPGGPGLIMSPDRTVGSINKAAQETHNTMKLTKSSSPSSNVTAKSGTLLEISKSALKTGTRAKTATSRPAIDPNDLGAGLDIKSVEIKQTHPEFDFFADMAPSIDTTSKSSTQEGSVATSAALGPESQASVNSKLFAVSAAPEQEEEGTAGWGDDDALDWDAEGF